MTPEPPAEQSTQRGPEGSAAAAPSLQRLATRLRRLEQQIRAFKELHVAELNDLARRQQAIAQLHADELQLILDELADIAGELATPREAESQGDPAASSPKRERWLAEEERQAPPAPVSRRELLRGRGGDP